MADYRIAAVVDEAASHHSGNDGTLYGAGEDPEIVKMEGETIEDEMYTVLDVDLTEYRRRYRSRPFG
jgi:hypothetical protein